jgi:hypothetical protein
MFARCSHLEARGVARGGTATHHVPCKNIHGTTAGIHRGTSHNDGKLGSMKGPRALTHRGATVLRLDGQHTGRARFPAVRLYVVGTTQRSIQGVREGELGRGVLTSSRRCSRGRLDGVALGVGVPTLPWPSRPAWRLPSPAATSGPAPPPSTVDLSSGALATM